MFSIEFKKGYILNLVKLKCIFFSYLTLRALVFIKIVTLVEPKRSIEEIMQPIEITIKPKKKAIR